MLAALPAPGRGDGTPASGPSGALQPGHRGLEHVVRVPRPLALGQDVADARRLEHRADGAAGDDARALGRRLEQHPARAEVAEHLVGDGVARQRHLEEVLLRLLAALADGLGHLVGLAQADADVPVAVADDHQRRRS